MKEGHSPGPLGPSKASGLQTSFSVSVPPEWVLIHTSFSTVLGPSGSAGTSGLPGTWREPEQTQVPGCPPVCRATTRPFFRPSLLLSLASDESLGSALTRSEKSLFVPRMGDGLSSGLGRRMGGLVDSPCSRGQRSTSLPTGFYGGQVVHPVQPKEPDLCPPKQDIDKPEGIMRTGQDGHPVTLL